MQTGRHIGKIIVRIPEDSPSLESIKDRPSPSLRFDHSYLLVGGLGGLGRAVSTWMVEQGARHLIFLSRSAESDSESQGFLEELYSQGCEVQLVAGSISNLADVERAVQSATKPIAGVINLSMVLKVLAPCNDLPETQTRRLTWTFTGHLPQRYDICRLDHGRGAEGSGYVESA